MPSWVKREEHSQRTSSRGSELLHVGVLRATDLTNHRSLQRRAMLREKHDAIIERLLLFDCQRVPPFPELVGVPRGNLSRRFET